MTITTTTSLLHTTLTITTTTTTSTTTTTTATSITGPTTTRNNLVNASPILHVSKEINEHGAEDTIVSGERSPRADTSTLLFGDRCLKGMLSRPSDSASHVLSLAHSSSSWVRTTECPPPQNGLFFLLKNFKAYRRCPALR